MENEDDEWVETYTTAWHVGKVLEMICLDRDWFVMKIPKNQLDCIWTIPSDSNFYDSIRVTFGEITVENSEKILDRWNSKFIKNHEFAFYNGHIFRSFSGYNHHHWFKLSSNDLKTQELGFIMEEPGIFNKCVSPQKIDFAFESQTYCTYNDLEFIVIDSSLDNKLLIEPFDRTTYPDKVLLEMCFEIINTKFAKWVEPKMLDTIWTKTGPIHDFDEFVNKDEILKDK